MSLVVHAHGRPLVVDAGTGSYTTDPAVRDRFRGTAAHATVVLGGEEQSPFFAGRPFALPEAAHTESVRVEDFGEEAALEAAHHGYQRLPARAIHRRRITLRRALDVLVVEDELEGRGVVPVEIRFPLAQGLSATLQLSAAARSRLAALGSRLGALDLARAIEVPGHALFIPGPAPGELTPQIQSGWISTRFAEIHTQPLVAWVGLLSLPQTVATTVIFLSHGPTSDSE
jgi:hypothetical protein